MVCFYRTRIKNTNEQRNAHLPVLTCWAEVFTQVKDLLVKSLTYKERHVKGPSHVALVRGGFYLHVYHVRKNFRLNCSHVQFIETSQGNSHFSFNY